MNGTTTPRTPDNKAIALHPICSPPTPEEITRHREAMVWADKAMGHDPRDYSDSAVIEALTEPMPDSGGTALGEARALKQLFSVAHPFEENKNTTLHQ